jgi:predicted permease
MKKFLVLLFVGIILTMLVVTSLASLKRPIWNSSVEFHWKSSPWSVATLFDAYFGFLTFYIWVAYKERTAVARLVWFILIMALGNMAMSAYMLLQLSKLRTGQSLEALLLRAK